MCGLLVLAMGGRQAVATEIERIFRPSRESRGDTNVTILQAADEAAWIWCEDADANQVEFLRFRCSFESEDGEPFELDVSADERFALLLDGRLIARGPHRGLPVHWYYQSYAVRPSPGTHVLEAVCWCLGDSHAPIAQLSWRGGFLAKASGKYDTRLTTGKAVWRVARLANTRMTGKGASETYGVGSECSVKGTSFLGEVPPDARWRDACVVREAISCSEVAVRKPGWMLFPTRLPDMLEERRAVGTFHAPSGTSAAVARELESLLRENHEVRVPPHCSWEVLWDLGNYYCAYPELVADGGKGAEVSWGWTESLRDGAGNKGNRNEWVGKTFAVGMEDVFCPDGCPNARFDTPWWRCGRWCRLRVKTDAEPLVIRRIGICETRYPSEMSASFECDDESLADVMRICRRGLECCTHEMFFDCPYYEQQMYPGDSRVEFLTLTAVQRDDRLIRQSFAAFDYSRRTDGFVAMNFPTRGEQESATYSMCFVTMFRDWLMEHDDAGFIRGHLPGMRHCLEGLALYEDADGLLRDLPGWSFVDWAGWTYGRGGRGLVNLQYLYTLRLAAEVETAVGEDLLAERLRLKTDRLGAAIRDRYWDAGRNLFADDDARTSWSEHAQCFAILSDILSEEESAKCYAALMDDKNEFHRASVYFLHYLFEVMLRREDASKFFDRLRLWRKYLDSGLCTPCEEPHLESRSDCHAWGSHPLYHLQRGIAGITSAAVGFKRVRVRPCPGHLRRIRVRSPHPRGWIEEDLAFGAGGDVRGVVVLPPDVTGSFEWRGRRQELHPGQNEIVVGRK